MKGMGGAKQRVGDQRRQNLRALCGPEQDLLNDLGHASTSTQICTQRLLRAVNELCRMIQANTMNA